MKTAGADDKTSRRRLHRALRAPYAHLRAEWWAVRQLGLRRLAHTPFERRSRWWNDLPVQRARTVVLEGVGADVGHALRSADVPFAESTHTLYVPPSSLMRSPFAGLAEGYPGNAGLKVCKRIGGIDQAYVYDAAPSWIQRAITYGPRHLSLVANLLHGEGLGPRLHDVLELHLRGAKRAAFVVEHVEGRPPTASEWEAGMARLRALEARGGIQVSALRGFRSVDFDCPGCNGNAWVDPATGRFHYVDFQNFLLVEYPRRLATLAAALREPEDEREVREQITALGEALTRHDASLEGRCVIDLGHSARRTAECLGAGAHWVHAPARDDPEGDAWLLALGCTRFSSGAVTTEGPPCPRGAPRPLLLLCGPRGDESLRAWTRVRPEPHWEHAFWVDAPDGSACPDRWSAIEARPLDVFDVGGRRCALLASERAAPPTARPDR